MRTMNGVTHLVVVMTQKGKLSLAREINQRKSLTERLYSLELRS